MGTIYIDGLFRPVTKPVKIVSGSNNYNGTRKPSILLEDDTKVSNNLILESTENTQINLKDNKAL